MAEIRLPPATRPSVSIVMATFNAVTWVRRALEALVEHSAPCYELIVVDNGSGEETLALLRELDHATVILNGTNVGFGQASNLGAAHASSRRLLFLNSDVLVHSGWLEPLLAAIEAHEQVGAVGPMLLNLDGSLQLAGALVGRSGSTAEYGFGDQVERREYGFTRTVDFLSGSCLLVRRDAFEEVGGFEPAYGLAYYEDADLCLALSARSYRVLYEPRSRVTHVRGGSGGGEALSDLVLANRGLFERRWRRVLASRPPAPLDRRRRLLAARDAPASARLLVVGEPELMQTAASLCPFARIAAVDCGDDLPVTVECVAREDLEERRFLYDVVVAGVLDRELEFLLKRTQPQAARVSPERAGFAAALAEAGILTES